jgi:hypothetical protein
VTTKKEWKEYILIIFSKNVNEMDSMDGTTVTIRDAATLV